jgi:hypothetical protein
VNSVLGPDEASLPFTRAGLPARYAPELAWWMFECGCGGISGRGNPCGCLRSISCRIAVDPVRSVDKGVILPEGPRSRSGRIPFQSAGFSEKPQLG